MAVRVGIPKSLLYYNYYPAWKVFFQELGVEVIESRGSNRDILDKGVKLAVDEACLPVKICHGHVVDLCDRVDYIFLPRIVSVEKNEYVCPKLMGLPDMIRSNLSSLPKVLTPTINQNQDGFSLFKANLKIGSHFTNNTFKIFKAHWKSIKALKDHQRRLIKQINSSNKLVIALLGHAYLLYDEYINLGIIDKLNDLGVEVITPQNLKMKEINKGASKLSKALFWTFNKKIIGSAYYLFDRKDIDGIIQLAAFGCGPDALIGELIERKAKRRKDLHFMSLNLDEHSGEAGLMTRLEAFVDMIKWEAKEA
jgi:predicted nucleotide-binding protein (sugar kinase/HSP70/actin superfamily)